MVRRGHRILRAAAQPQRRVLTADAIPLRTARGLPAGARVLVDARAIHEVVSIADRFDLANRMVTARLPRIAILVTEANAVHSRAFEDTATNRGAMVCTTSNEAEACGFLGIALPTCTQR